MLYELEGRGRPTGRQFSQVDIRLLEYLARVSMKYKVDSDKLLDNLLDAYQHQGSKCGKLSIECRMRGKGYAILLMTRGRKVIGQFRISEQLLNTKTNPLKEFIRRQSAIRTKAQEAKSKSYKIRDLRAGMRRLNIRARVLEVSKPIQTATRSGFYANLANAVIADETGTINLSLLGSQIKGVTLHDVIKIENAHVVWFRGERQLRVGKHGKINVANSTANDINIAHSD